MKNLNLERLPKKQAVLLLKLGQREGKYALEMMMGNGEPREATLESQKQSKAWLNPEWL